MATNNKLRKYLAERGIASKSWKRSAVQNRQTQTKTDENENSGQPVNSSNYGPFNESIVPRRQKQGQAQNSSAQKVQQDKSQKGGFIDNAIDKTDKWANKHLNSNQYGPFNESIVPRRQKYAEKQKNKAQEVKEDFENRMGEMKENLQSAPIKQEPGESSYAFRRRQQKQDDESPDNIKDRSLKDVAGQRLRTGVNKRIEKTLKDNPKAAAAIARANAIKKLAALKAEGINRRIKALKKLKRRLNLKKLAEDKLKELMARIAAQASRVILQIVVSAMTAIIAAFSEVIVVLLIIIVIMVALDYMCNNDPLSSAVCSTVAGIGHWFGF